MKNILIEGWRGISQSLAMVNQYQLIELAKYGEFNLYHHDQPHCMDKWSSPENDPQFPPNLAATIRSFTSCNSENIDTVFRIAFPFARSQVRARRTLSYMITEWGLREHDFAPAQSAIDNFCDGNNLVITPSNWSRNQIIKFGFPADKVRLVSHGVNPDVFYPLTPVERATIREELELSNDDFVFLNIGAVTDNKGIDCLLRAFSIVRQRYSNVRLVLKDSANLYGISVQEFIHKHVASHGPLSADVAASISLVPSSLSLAEMRLLYGAADAYLSPYRAEGFNLPVIEAIATGTPVIVTAGGATDDFCNDAVALRIDAEEKLTQSYFDGWQSARGETYLEPDLDSTVAQMERALSEDMPKGEKFAAGRLAVIDQFSWKTVTKQLAAIFLES